MRAGNTRPAGAERGLADRGRGFFENGGGIIGDFKGLGAEGVFAKSPFFTLFRLLKKRLPNSEKKP